MEPRDRLESRIMVPRKWPQPRPGLSIRAVRLSGRASAVKKPLAPQCGFHEIKPEQRGEHCAQFARKKVLVVCLVVFFLDTRSQIQFRTDALDHVTACESNGCGRPICYLHCHCRKRPVSQLLVYKRCRILRGFCFNDLLHDPKHNTSHEWLESVCQPLWLWNYGSKPGQFPDRCIDGDIDPDKPGRPDRHGSPDYHDATCKSGGD